jgi:hypothetical protein
MGFFFTHIGELTMKNRFATKTMSSLTLKQLIDIADKGERWDYMTRAAIRHLWKKSKDQHSQKLLESYVEEELSGIA